MNIKKTFIEKCNYYLLYLYENGGQERKSIDIDTFSDFNNALAENAEEFHRIIESLLDENLICYDNNSVVRGDWIKDIQAHYHNVLLTPAGKRAVSEPISSNQLIKMPSNTFHFGDGAKFHLVQGDGAIQTNTGDNAVINVAKGNNNNQSNQTGQATSLSELVEQVKQALHDTAFNSNREEINQEFERIEIQLNKAEPKKTILERAFGSLQELAADSAGAVAGHTVFELLKQAPHLLAVAGIG